jgi:hypothetical protein
MTREIVFVRKDPYEILKRTQQHEDGLLTRVTASDAEKEAKRKLPSSANV